MRQSQFSMIIFRDPGAALSANQQALRGPIWLAHNIPHVVRAGIRVWRSSIRLEGPVESRNIKALH